MAQGRSFHRGRGGGGRGRGKNKGGRGGRGGGGGQRNFVDNRVSFDQVNKHNEKFERFYNSIPILPAGPEQDAFWAALRRELPNSFRFTGSKGHALLVRDTMVDRYFPVLSEIQHEGRPVEVPKQMSWYPNGLAYTMTTPKNVIRKYGPFKEFQKFLVNETGVGNISRQEQVSMIPPMLLDVQPEHTVLDLCAAPGSKSAQLIELIHAGEEGRVAQAVASANRTELDDRTLGQTPTGHGGLSTGLLIANDVNYKRAQMLVHQVKRLNSPNIIATNYDATMFPSIKLPPANTTHQTSQGRYLKFDRILADVPCSGDGTCRKNPNIWKDWTPQNALGLYITQVRILTRALQMLKVGGRVAYSTCSLNPVENEAVVASAIERCGGVGKVKIIDCSGQLDGLIRSPGLSDWSVMSKEGQVFESWSEAQQYDPSRIVPGMFAPESAEQIPLERCMRVYPHQQDTGGFFITILEKLEGISAKPEPDSKCAKKDWVFTPPDATQTATTVDANGRDDTACDIQAPLPNPDAPDRSTVDTDVPFDGADALFDKPVDDIEADTNVDGQAEKEENNSEMDAEASANPSEDFQQQNNLSRLNGGVKRAAPEDGMEHPTAKRPKADGNQEFFIYLSPEHEELVSIYHFYGLHPSFPRDQFLVRNPAGDPVKGIYFTSQLVKDILQANNDTGMKFVHAGVKMFVKQDAQGQDICRWRIQTEGLPIVEGWVSDKRVVRLTKKSTLRKLLVEMFPKVFTHTNEKGEEVVGWQELNEIGEQVRDMPMGCCVLRVEASPNPSEDGFEEPMTLPLWRSMYSLNLMLPKDDRKAMLLRIYNEEVELVNHDKNNTPAKTDNKPNGGDAAKNGSVPAEYDAKELQEKFENIAHDQDETANSDAAPPGAQTESALELEAVAMEQQALEARDVVEQKRLEVLEDPNRKVTEAMPERDGEGDDYNTTV